MFEGRQEILYIFLDFYVSFYIKIIAFVFCSNLSTTLGTLGPKSGILNKTNDEEDINLRK